MNNKGVKLEPKLVGDISGDFFIPSYQRGYRWDKEQVEKLLDDILENGSNNYCLQPIVVKNKNNVYELIDGQQRLTTLFIILNFMKNERYKPRINVKFSLNYQTRPNSKAYLENIEENSAEKNIDFYHIHGAYKAIKGWFLRQKNDSEAVDDIYQYLCKFVKVIWYETNEDENSTDLFTRLNIGKIPLTNAELVRALFLSRDNNSDITEEKQIEIATNWDIMEKELYNEEFWGFLTNKKASKYNTRIELLFEMIADKHEHEKEKYYTFYFFSDKISIDKISISDLWRSIQNYYLRLKEWFENRDIYHKVGYLVATGSHLQSLIKKAEGKKKSIFLSELDEEIKKKISISAEGLWELSYENGSHKGKIENILLLFNVEAIRRLKNSLEKYSFNMHKSKQWSLEHIHAQNSQGLNKKEDQQEWLRLHLKSLRIVAQTSDSSEIGKLIDKIETKYQDIDGATFEQLFKEVTKVLSEQNENKDYLHSLSNMALLSFENNAALNNSTFDVKRDKILQMDNEGDYIPICTKRVFLKYYTESKDYQLHFWGENDRLAYMNAMAGEDGILSNYLG
ncbi:MAG TPA: DUF262 domain-containing protein [Dysgonomonas sp.]|uniref:DUF262 domain-containing protein n=1 Tax=unclassified Dysgonomonas TaxID=2630389 RepID=UPI0025C4296F|nr:MULTISPECIES: DUF262 domain-containing protein [unclassified Dysgonomonas]HML65275.1 DUF262 domain-containing protein [Dysgonomonas sp.]